MKVYILLGLLYDEGNDVISVHKSIKGAADAKQKAIQDGPVYNEFVIEEREVQE